MFHGSNIAFRLAWLIFWLLCASLLVFTLFHYLPGDAASIMLGINATAETLTALEQQLNLNQPFWYSYFYWIGNILQGNLGHSLIYQTAIADLLPEKINLSLSLALCALVFSNSIAIPLGIWLALKHYHGKNLFVARFFNLSLMIFLAIPTFWCAMLLILLFALQWQIFPAGGFNPNAPFQSLFLPTLALSLPQIAIMGRFTRIQTLNILNEPFIFAEFCKGCSETRIIFKHILKNIAVPLLTLANLQFVFLFSGTIVVENIFFLPGMGQFAVQSLLKRDITSLQITFLFFTLLLLSLNFLTDWLTRTINVRTSEF